MKVFLSIAAVIVLPIIIYMIARVISLGVFRSFYEVKSQFINLKKETKNVTEGQTEKEKK